MFVFFSRSVRASALGRYCKVPEDSFHFVFSRSARASARSRYAVLRFDHNSRPDDKKAKKPLIQNDEIFKTAWHVVPIFGEMNFLSTSRYVLSLNPHFFRRFTTMFLTYWRTMIALLQVGFCFRNSRFVRAVVFFVRKNLSNKKKSGGVTNLQTSSPRMNHKNNHHPHCPCFLRLQRVQSVLFIV